MFEPSFAASGKQNFLQKECFGKLRRPSQSRAGA